MVQGERPRRATFLIRLWAEDDETPESSWRGQVEHVQSGENQYVQEMAQVVSFIEERLDRGAAGAADRGIR
jgi:hypothetical protein